MNENDFYVAIQYVLERAKDNGWSLENIERAGHDAIAEFVAETELTDIEKDAEE